VVVSSNRKAAGSRAARRRRAEIVLIPGLFGRLLRGRWLAITLLVLVAFGVMVQLGFWQKSRLDGRRAANAAISGQIAAPLLTLDGATLATADPASLIFRRVIVRGTWDYDHEVELRYRSFDGQPGVHLLTPLRVDGSDRAILVDRGWIPFDWAGPERRTEFRQGATGEVQGLVYESIHQNGSPTSTGGDRLDAFTQVDLAAIGAQESIPLAPFWVRRLPTGDNLTPPRAEGLPDLSNGTHLAYMIQWWAFAATLLITYVIFANQMLWREQKRRKSGGDDGDPRR
jgi:surfeit locus 1 family protein